MPTRLMSMLWLRPPSFTWRRQFICEILIYVLHVVFRQDLVSGFHPPSIQSLSLNPHMRNMISVILRYPRVHREGKRLPFPSSVSHISALPVGRRRRPCLVHLSSRVPPGMPSAELANLIHIPNLLLKIILRFTVIARGSTSLCYAISQPVKIIRCVINHMY